MPSTNARPDTVSSLWRLMERKPTLAGEAKVTAPGTVVIDYEGRTERVTSDGEQELTNGLIKVVAGKTHKVYFVQGHGEHAAETNDRTGYSTIAASLKNDNFETDNIVLAQQKSVPDDASVLVVAGPKTDFFPAEVDMRIRLTSRLRPARFSSSDHAHCRSSTRRCRIQPPPPST